MAERWDANYKYPTDDATNRFDASSRNDTQRVLNIAQMSIPSHDFNRTPTTNYLTSRHESPGT